MFWLSSAQDSNRKVTILNQLESITPRDSLTRMIDHSYDKKVRGRKRTPSILLLKMMILQFVFGLSDEAVQEDLFDRKSFYNFVWEDLLQKWGVPDATTLCKFRKHLQDKRLHDKFFKIILDNLAEKWAFLKKWTLVDSTIVKAASSTKNKENERDPEMKSTKKWNNYHFGMKIHQWTDVDTGIVHTVKCTSANVSDTTVCEELLHGEESYAWWDKWYASRERKKLFRSKWIVYGILDKKTRKRALSSSQKKRNSKFQSIKAKVELPFWIFKKWRGNTKVRYRWLYKNTVRATIGLAVWNLFLWQWYLNKVTT